MARVAVGLTARAVATAKTAGMIADGGGLYLAVAASGAKSWIYRFKLGERRRDMGLGAVADLSLADARDRAAEARKLVKAGIDPIEARDRAAKAEARDRVTFAAFAADHIEARRAEWGNPKHAAQWAATLATYAHPVMGAMAVAAIDTETVLRVLRPIWNEKPETASRVRGRIEAILDAAKVRGLREGENPARWKGHLDQVLSAKGKVAPVAHHASMAYADLPAFWPRLKAADGMGARALELAILTAARSGEVLGARWDEFDLDAAVWTVPAARMKAGIQHRVPLAPGVLDLLRVLAAVRQGPFLFAGMNPARHLSGMAMAMTLRRMGVEVTVHGFRSTFRTWAAERTGAAHEVAEAALAHTQGDKVVAAYQRGDLFEKRRRLMDAWAAFTTTAPGAAVVRMRRAG